MGGVLVIEGEGCQHRRIDAELRLDTPARQAEADGVRIGAGARPRGDHQDGPDHPATAFQEVAQLRHAVGSFTSGEYIDRTLPERQAATGPEAHAQQSRHRVAVGRRNLARANLRRAIRKS